MLIMPEGKVQYGFDYEDYNAFIEFNKRHITYNGEVEDDVFDLIAYNVLRYNEEDKGLPVEQRKPIILYINSPGGETKAGALAIDSIVTSITPVYTVCCGKAMSMAFLIMLAGKKRYSMPNSTFLMHDGSVGYWDSVSKARDMFDFETNQSEQRIRKFVLERTKITEKKYDEMYRSEWYMYPQEAKELGIIDHIIGEDCTIEEII